MKQVRWGTMVGLLALSACQSGGGTTPITNTPPTSVVTSTTTTAAPTTAAPTTAATTTTAASTTTVPAFPAENTNLVHGGEVWVVVLAASQDFNDPVLAQAVADAEEAGYTTGPTDCDAGAAEAVGHPEGENYYTVSVYLESETDAHTALQAFAARGVEGTVALVQTFCLD